MSLSDGLLSIEVKDIDLITLLKQVSEVAGIPIEVKAVVSGRLSVSLQRKSPEEAVALILEAAGEQNVSLEFSRSRGMDQDQFKLERIIVVRRGNAAPKTQTDSGKSGAAITAVLSKDRIREIGNTRIIKEVLYENAASQGDPTLVEGLECGEPYLRWAIGRKDLVLHPEVWVVPLRNKKKMLVAERSLHVDTGKNFTGSPPSKDLDLHSFELPQDIGAIQAAARKRYGLEVGRADLEKAVVLGFWDAKLYWMFPKRAEADVVSRFNAAIRDNGRLGMHGIADSFLLVPIDPFRKGHKELGIAEAQMIISLADRISHKESDELRAKVMLVEELNRKSQGSELSAQDQATLQWAERQLEELARDPVRKRAIEKIRMEMGIGEGQP